MMGCTEEKVKNLRAIVESSIIYENRNTKEKREILGKKTMHINQTQQKKKNGKST